jgi:hypothetical protein
MALAMACQREERTKTKTTPRKNQEVRSNRKKSTTHRKEICGMMINDRIRRQIERRRRRKRRRRAVAVIAVAVVVVVVQRFFIVIIQRRGRRGMRVGMSG